MSFAVKFCRRCETWKTLDRFNRCSKHKDGLQYECKTCKYKITKAWSDANKERHRELQRNWEHENQQFRNEYKRYLLPKYRTRMNFNENKRRANKLKAIPKWANLDKIKAIYVEASNLGMSVDHIVPLQSEFVCGLHVENNLEIIPLIDNMSKNNRYWPDMFGD